MNKKIKIAYVIDELNIGGTEKQLVRTIELLDKSKFEVFLICLRPSQYFYSISLPCERHVLNVTSLFSINGLKEFIWFVLYLKKKKVDIIQTNFFDSCFFGILAAKLAGVNKIISCRRDMGFWYTANLLRILKIINVFADRFLVNSNAVKGNISKYESIQLHKIDVIYNGIDLGFLKNSYDKRIIKENLGINNNEYLVGIIANFNRQVKRIDLFIKAGFEVLKKHKNTSFIILGDGSLKGELVKLTEILKINKKFHFLGTKEDVYPYLNIFDVGVLTSDSEGFSNSILEYFALGIPVVCTDVGGNHEIVENSMNGFLAQKGDALDIAKYIIKILDDEVLRSSMQKNNRKNIRNFSWENSIKTIENYYTSILSN